MSVFAYDFTRMEGKVKCTLSIFRCLVLDATNDGYWIASHDSYVKEFMISTKSLEWYSR